MDAITENKTAQKLLSSIGPSVAGIILSYPTLTLKVNQQVIGSKPKNLYAGMGWYLTKSVPANSITFMMLQSDYIQTLNPWMQGAVSRLTAEATVYPLSLWSQRQQVGLKAGGYFRGIGPTLGRDVIFSSVFLQIYRGWLGDGKHAIPGSEYIPLPIRIMCAATGASMASQPLDWFKVRAQLRMPMNGLSSGWAWRLAYCNVRSVVAWGLFELLRPNKGPSVPRASSKK